MRDDFAVFIITHGRPNNQKTLEVLKKGGYKGKLYLVLDDEDETADLYIEKYGPEKIIFFNKDEVGKRFDLGDNRHDIKSVSVFARNACFDIAKKLGIRYFLELDDDYKSFCFRHIVDKKLKSSKINDYDRLFSAMCDFLACNNIYSLAFGVEGDFIGGLKGRYKDRLYQNARNSYFCCVDKPFDFMGRINEDVTTPAYNNAFGRMFYTVCDVCVTAIPREKNTGGIGEFYQNESLYSNYFYPVLWLPSAIKIDQKKNVFNKKVNIDCLGPKLICERWKK